MNNKLSFISFVSLWFGAAISLAELMTGGLLAGSGFKSAVAAIIIGHIIGTLILILGGYIGFKEKIPAIEGTKASFGNLGTKLFGILNIIQLTGWTTIMIIIGARTFNEVALKLWGIDNFILWAAAIGILIAIWIAMGIQGFKYLNTIAAGLLFALTIILSFSVFKNRELIEAVGQSPLSFGAMIELNVVMPLSWLPLIADYTRFAENKAGAVAGSFIGYFIGSTWMYIIGLALALTSGTTDIGGILIASRLGFVAAGVILLSTITTTFMDAYSAGVSSSSIIKGINEKNTAIAITVLSTMLAAFFPMEQYENFLYLIGSVFAPLFAVVYTNYFILRKKKDDGAEIKLPALISWASGVVLYHIIKNKDIFLGVTVPVMLITALIFVIINKLAGERRGLRA
ncbi:cytosine permease [Oxobacter pfennigii]|uniref:Cytosine permease n=1 Tax=Oxobacter pfennigii TaxID=36849 RepID=A0A0P8Z081_9CLOT|nr:putative hydroxymethylpyrimidine transporter CytX [Oxobacter pfennigii]KPU45541.1 cytosine permease [Oxobacter pfennigii]